MQNIILDSSKQILREGRFLGDHVFGTLAHFCQTNTYNEIIWLLLIVLEKVGKEKDELKDLNFQFKPHINDLKASVSALKETFIS